MVCRFIVGVEFVDVDDNDDDHDDDDHDDDCSAPSVVSSGAAAIEELKTLYRAKLLEAFPGSRRCSCALYRRMSLTLFGWLATIRAFAAGADEHVERCCQEISSRLLQKQPLVDAAAKVLCLFVFLFPFFFVLVALRRCCLLVLVRDRSVCVAALMRLLKRSDHDAHRARFR